MVNTCPSFSTSSRVSALPDPDSNEPCCLQAVSDWRDGVEPGCKHWWLCIPVCLRCGAAGWRPEQVGLSSSLQSLKECIQLSSFSALQLNFPETLLCPHRQFGGPAKGIGPFTAAAELTNARAGEQSPVCFHVTCPVRPLLEGARLAEC